LVSCHLILVKWYGKIPFCPPEFRQKKTAEQMENSSPSHGYFPAGKFRYPVSRRRAPTLRKLQVFAFSPSFSICDIRIQKQISRSFGKSFPQKIVLPKLRPHCSATLPEYLESLPVRSTQTGRTPKRKMSFPF